VGDSGCGKTSLLLRFTDDVFGDELLMSNFDNKIRVLNVYNRSVKVQVWDTAGQEMFKSITASFYRGAQGILIIFDLANAESFTNVQHKWVSEVERYADPKATRMLVGTKLDLTGERQVKKEDVEDFARRLAMDYLETSALKNTNVEAVFRQTAHVILEQMDENGDL